MKHDLEPLQPDPEDTYEPRAMAEPRMLFRSMALGELVQIMRTGKVVGGGNIFHDGEDRPYVFFGGELNVQLLGNGESLDRCAAMAFRDHSIHGQIADAASHIKYRRKAILRELRRDRVRFNAHDMWAFRSGGAGGPFIRSLSRCRKIDRPKFARLLRAYGNALSAQRSLGARQTVLMRSAFSDLARRVVSQPYSSAVIVTYPVAGGLEYREEFGAALNGGEPEYGFRPGQITIDDIMEVLLVKDGAIVRRIPSESFSELEAICCAAMDVEPADQATKTWCSRWGDTLTVTCRASGEWEWSISGETIFFGLRLPWVFD